MTRDTRGKERAAATAAAAEGQRWAKPKYFCKITPVVWSCLPSPVGVSGERGSADRGKVGRGRGGWRRRGSERRGR